jgi:aminoglycoside phosphotransferase (APT) family kinase protein
VAGEEPSTRARKPIAVDPELPGFLVRAGLAREGAPQAWNTLGGGVSSDIWRVDLEDRAVCVKRALAKLRVAADWRAPVSRNLYEWRWFETVRTFLPEAVPTPLAADHALGVFAMSYLDEASHPVWKSQLLRAEVDVAVARAVGDRLGRIHAATARNPEIAARFPTDDLFHALRPEPYLLAAADRHPPVAGALRGLVERTEATHLTLVHGDVSPKNILVGPDGPVFLDAETAWYGDPAFDLAFCLNHLLLKRLAAPAASGPLIESFDALAQAYLARVAWEPSADLESRAAALLPGLLLARVDGKSPVEYLTAEIDKNTVRAAALPLIAAAPTTLAEVATAWTEQLTDR